MRRVELYPSMSLSLPTAALWLTLCLSGCALEQTAPPVPLALPVLTGGVHGGNQAVSLATLQIFVAGTSGYGSAAVPLIPAGSYFLGGAPGCVASSAQTCYPMPMSGPSGYFSLTGDYTCPSPGAQVYLTATGGNPGLAAGTNNTSLALMAALGSCGALSAATYINLNEVTTVGAVWALAPFMTGYANVGSSATNALGMQTAFFTAAQLVSASTGSPVPSTAATTVPVAELNTLGNILAACVNSDGGTAAGTSCGSLFSATTPSGTPSGGTPPADTISAALSIARNPASNVASVFALAAANPPFQPTLKSAPPDWTVGILTYVNGITKFPISGIVDASNNYWEMGFYYGGHAAVSGPSAFFSSDNVFYFAEKSAFGLDGTLYLPDANQTSGYGRYNTDHSSSYGIDGSSFYPVGLAIAGNGNLWFFFGSGNVAETTPDGTLVSPAAGFTGFISCPNLCASAFDATGNLYVSNGNSLQKINTTTAAPTATSITGGGLTAPAALAIEHSGNIWVANCPSSGGPSILEFSNIGTPITSLNTPTGCNGMAIDGDGNVWTGGPTGLMPFSSAGAALSPIGLGSAVTLGNGESGIAIDGAGSVWGFTANTQSYEVGVFNPTVQLVGLAAPVVTPFSVAVKNNALGVRP